MVDKSKRGKLLGEFQEKKNNHIDHSLQNTKDEKKVNTDFEGRNTKDADTEWFPFSH